MERGGRERVQSAHPARPREAQARGLAGAPRPLQSAVGGRGLEPREAAPPGALAPSGHTCAAQGLASGRAVGRSRRRPTPNACGASGYGAAWRLRKRRATGPGAGRGVGCARGDPPAGHRRGLPITQRGRLERPRGAGLAQRGLKGLSRWTPSQLRPPGRRRRESKSKTRRQEAGLRPGERLRPEFQGLPARRRGHDRALVQGQALFSGSPLSRGATPGDGRLLPSPLQPPPNFLPPPPSCYCQVISWLGNNAGRGAGNQRRGAHGGVSGAGALGPVPRAWAGNR